MIDIYDEEGYVKVILEEGLSQKWERDASLLTRFYKAEGIGKPDARKKIKEKCEIAASRKVDPIYYRHIVSYKRLNSVVDKAWKDKTPIRKIKQVEFSKEVLDWFLSLSDTFIISDEEVERLKKKYPKISIKKNKPINWQRTKYLFTLYIWTLIQENYLDRPNMHYLKQYSKRFKEDADLKQSFSMNREREFLRELGLLKVNFSMGIDATFIKKFPVFETEINNDNRIVLKTGDPPHRGEAPEGDLYNCGYWLEKQKYGTFVCQNCGKEFIHYTLSKREKARKYCKECSELIRHGKTNEQVRHVICIDCGKEFDVPIKDTKTLRCYDCQEERDRARKREWARRQSAKNDIS